MHIKNIFSSLSIFPKTTHTYMSEDVQKRNLIRKCMEEQAYGTKSLNPFQPQEQDTFELSADSISTEQALNILWPD